MTDDIVEVLLQAVLLIVVTYIAVFGGVGALLARSRSGGMLWGFIVGFLVPFAGWAWIAWRTRDGVSPDHRRRQLAAAADLDDPTQMNRPGSTQDLPSDLAKYEY